MAASTKQDFLVNFLNTNFDTMKSLHRLDSLRDEYKKQIEALEEKISKASTEIPSEIDKAVSMAKTMSKHINKLEEKVDSLCHDIFDHDHAIKPMVGELELQVEKIAEVEKYAHYLSTVAKIEDLSSHIQASLLTESLSSAVDSFNDLTEMYTALQSSSCLNLLDFLKESILFWHKILKDRIAIEFEEVLKALRWPLVVTTIKAPSVTNVTELKERMRKLFQKLLSLQLPESMSLESFGGNQLIQKIGGVKPLVLPLELMLKPLRKRFRYHFYGQKQTNSLDKPEWYLTQVLSWIRDHGDFLDRNIQPILDESKKGDISARVEFTRGLVITVMEKIFHDLPELAYEEANFSHLIDEVLLFDSELRNTYSYPPILPGCLDVLCLPEALTKWLIIEKKYAMQKIEQMLHSPSCWESQYKDISDLDEVRVPECAEGFMMLLQTITDRYRKLPVSDAKLQFLGLQLELLEDFRMRLVQVMKTTSTAPTGHIMCAVLNAVHYVTQVLRDWSELTFFLQLLCYKNNRSLKTEIAEPSDILHSAGASAERKSTDENVTEEDSVESLLAGLSQISMEHTVFEEITSLFESMEADMIKAACSYVFTDVQARSQAYRKDRWISLPAPKELSTTLGLSQSACEMFLVLKDHLCTMEKQLSKFLFDRFWHRLARNIDDFLFHEVILVNHFNDGGAVQLQFDITRNLIPLFGDYTNNPDSYFRLCKEASTLLTLKSGSALLLKEVIYSHLHETAEQRQLRQVQPDVGAALREVGIFTLSAEQSEQVLSLRTNLSVS
ncbi:rad50-interacting protein 1-like [Plakobranchus ocellatus]|uniref:Rad50-interacting protein 1-like n=1 Tax=Plakobranchus ocellatus TaxID=259542 RepID=A0AAV4A2X7_9GAST|nr:rad50-interacting protein 1-like [Plakobranchus ocellatus]